MPILNHNDLKKVEEYQTFVRTSPYANATQDLAWEKVKEGWVGEQVYLEENGKIIAAMSLIIRRVFAGFSLMYAPRAPICDLHDTALVQRLLDEAKPLAKSTMPSCCALTRSCRACPSWRSSTASWESGCATTAVTNTT